MFVITSKKFYDQFTDTGGGGVDFLNACTSDKVKCVIEGYFKWSMEVAPFIFNAANKTIAINDSAPILSFIRNEFKKGDSIAIIDTISNNGTFTIASVTDRVITVNESLTDETIDGASIFGTTPIEAIEYFYNVVSNSGSEDYNSATDVGTLQKYIAVVNSSSPETKLLIGTKSNGWVTDTLIGNESQESTITGLGTADYKQSFRIYSQFHQTVIWQPQLINNFKSDSPPSYLKGNNSLKHICRINGKASIYDPNVIQSGADTNTNGICAWFDENLIGSKPEYYIDSITYQKNDSEGDFIDKPNANGVTYCKMIIKSVNGKFVDESTKLFLRIFQCTNNNSELINTETTLLQNIREDEQFFTVSDGETKGINYDTDYQSLTAINSVFTDSSAIKITFKIDYSAATKAYLKAKAESERQFAIIVSTQDSTIATTKGTDRVNILCDFNTQTYNLEDDSLFDLVDYIRAYKYPNQLQEPTNNVKGFEGDLFLMETPVQMSTTVTDGISPTLMGVKMQIVATKSGETDKVIEEKYIDTSGVRKLEGVQDINITTQRGFKLPTDSLFNEVSIVRDPSNDDTDKAGYLIYYPFAIGYEYWLKLPNDGSTDIEKYFVNLNNVWSKYSQANDWAMCYRITFYVKGYENYTNEYIAQTPIVAYYPNSTDVGEGTKFTTDLKYYDESNVEIPTLLNGKTRVKGIFYGSTSLPSGFDGFEGVVFCDTLTGGLFSRNIANSETDAEIDSPFTTTGLPSLIDVINQWESANVRVTEFANRVEVDTFFTPPTKSDSNIVVVRLDYRTDDNVLLMADSTPILLSDNESIRINE